MMMLKKLKKLLKTVMNNKLLNNFLMSLNPLKTTNLMSESLKMLKKKLKKPKKTSLKEIPLKPSKTLKLLFKKLILMLTKKSDLKKVKKLNYPNKTLLLKD